MAVTVYSRLDAIAAGVPAKAEAVIYKTAHDVEGHAKGIVPVDTGFLQSGITVIPMGALGAEVDANAEYAMYVEYGTYKMAAQPYMVPAAEAVRPGFLAAMKAVFR